MVGVTVLPENDIPVEDIAVGNIGDYARACAFIHDDGVIVDRDVVQKVLLVEGAAVSPVLLETADSVEIVFHQIIVNLDIRAGGNQNTGFPQPSAVDVAVSTNDIVPDYGGKTDLVEDTNAGVVLYNIIFIQRVHVVDIRPKSGSVVVVYVVVPLRDKK